MGALLNCWGEDIGHDNDDDDDEDKDNDDLSSKLKSRLTFVDVVAALIGYVVNRLNLRLLPSDRRRVIALLHIDQTVAHGLPIQLDVVGQPIAEHQSMNAKIEN